MQMQTKENVSLMTPQNLIQLKFCLRLNNGCFIEINQQEDPSCQQVTERRHLLSLQLQLGALHWCTRAHGRINQAANELFSQMAPISFFQMCTSKFAYFCFNLVCLLDSFEGPLESDHGLPVLKMKKNNVELSLKRKCLIGNNII